ncbi:MAG: OmpA family protein [Alphaproteobacteria bacterium]|jgi:outer membrane protein OmpA-like peptidoglycan-associated protein|nr:OmpA family protein [Alphaproteobacteria bacterium]
MRLTPTLAVAAGLWLAATGVSLAQGVDSGLEVRVNPMAARPGGGTLLYPGGQYSRNVPPLLYPGERGGAIQLHMPGPRRRMVARAAAPKPPREPKPARVARAEPAPVRSAAPPAPTPNVNPFGGAPDLSNVFGSAAPPPRPQKTAPAGPTTGNESLTKRSVILFAKDAPDPAKAALGAIKFLANDLNAAMSGPNARVELQAFGGAKGDKGSDARRLSLKRALAIRQVLIDDGVAPDRIDVRAMGGVDDTGPADRVDVFVKA